MSELTLEMLRAELEPIKIELALINAELGPMKIKLDSLPLVHRTLSILQNDIRALRAAFNDFALQTVTPGEIQALHDDVNRVRARNAELETRIVTLERLVKELNK